MNIRALAARKAAGVGRSHPAMTRRRFVGIAAGTAVLGGALGAGLLRPGLAAPKMSFAPVHIPGGSPVPAGRITCLPRPRSIQSMRNQLPLPTSTALSGSRTSTGW